MEKFKDIAFLGLDHPGAKDPVYRKRRDQIAQLTQVSRERNEPAPVLDYTDEEHGVWRNICEKLAPLHEKYANEIYLEATQELGIPTDHIPQLRDLSDRVASYHGFRIGAIEGLVDSRSFLGQFSKRIMWCTQYIRHASRPEYTPEPDVIHEVVGHVPAFVDRDFCDLAESIGRAALLADDEQLVLLERIYWFTIEFGLIEESTGVKSYGAGLLGSFGELEHVYSGEVEWVPFVIEDVMKTTYNYSAMQSKLFIIPSFAFLGQEIERFLLEQGLADALKRETVLGV